MDTAGGEERLYVCVCVRARGAGGAEGVRRWDPWTEYVRVCAVPDVSWRSAATGVGRIAAVRCRCIYASDYASVSRRSPPLPSPALSARSPVSWPAVTVGTTVLLLGGAPYA